MPLNCTFKNGYSSRFYGMFILLQWKWRNIWEESALGKYSLKKKKEFPEVLAYLFEGYQGFISQTKSSRWAEHSNGTRALVFFFCHWVSFRVMFYSSCKWGCVVPGYSIRVLTQRPGSRPPCKMLLVLESDHLGLNLGSPTYQLQCLDKVQTSLSNSFLICKMGLVRVSILQDCWGYYMMQQR